MKIQGTIFWVVTQASGVVGYQCFREMAPFTSLWRCRQHGTPKYWYSTESLHGVTTQKTAAWIVL